MHFIIRLTLLMTISLFSIQSFAENKETAVESDSEAAIQWQPWSADVFDRAAAQNKLILLDIYAQWCPFCKKMKAITYKDPEVIKIVTENYLAVSADIEVPGDVQLVYGNLGVPGTAILTPQGKELNVRLGYITPQQMQWHLLGNLQDAPVNTKKLSSTSGK